MRARLRRFSQWIWLIAGVTAANAQQIQFAEPVDLAHIGNGAQFDAYGRRFALELTDNQRVLQKLPVQRKQALQRYHLMRGSLQGQPGSWVRLTESPSGTEGAIWDGHDLYAVTTYEHASAWLTTPLNVAPGQTVIYRLSDARDLLPKNFCALGDALDSNKNNGLDQYRSLVKQLKDDTGGITQQVDIALIADSAFASSEAPDPTAAMLARLNIVEGIFAEQVGLLVQATELRVMTPATDPFSSTDATTLLQQLGHYRSADAQVRARGIAHLMTGKNLDGSTAGIAYVDAVCDADLGVSLSERSYTTTISALLMAHELGHNFGAPHDGQAGACQSVGGGFIMAPTISGFATFSQCSVDQMHAALARASCVTPASYSDIALETDRNHFDADGGVPFTLPFVLRSTGTQPATDVTFTLALPDDAGLALDAVTAEGGSCSVTGMTAVCDFGDLAAGEQRAISVTVRGTVSANITAHARVNAGNDKLISDNSQDIAITMRSGIDAAVQVSTDQPQVPLGAPLTVYTDLSSLRALPVRNAVLTLNLNQPVQSASMPGADCTVSGDAITCNVAELASGSSARLTATANTASAGPLLATASVSAVGDGDDSNDSAQARAWIQADRDVEVSVSAPRLDLAVGSTYQIPFLVRSRGPQVTGDATLTITVPAGAVQVSGIDGDATTCSQAGVSQWSCALGALASGEARLVILRVRGTQVANVDVNAVVDATGDDYLTNNRVATQLRVDNQVDVGVIMASGGTGFEDDDIAGQALLRAGGRQAATGATLDVDLNVAGSLQSVHVHEGADCQLLSAQHARCALPPMQRDDEIYVIYHARFAAAGNYDVKFTLHVPGDTESDNDTLVRPVLVRPYYDVGVAGNIDLSDLVVGGSRESTFTVSATRRTLANARFSARNYLPALRVESIRAGSGTCSVDPDLGGICDFADLAADASVVVTVTWKAEAAAAQDVAVTVSAPGDVVPGNDTVKGRAEVLALTDIELRVDPVATATRGATVSLPPISIVNGAAKAVGTRLEVTLPAGVTLVSMSAADALCSGTTALRCDFASLDANSTATVNISVRAAERGDYLNALKLSAINDTNPANDAGQLKLEVSDTSAAAAAAAPAKGGGGGFEWLTLALLALLKWGQTPFAGKKCRT